MLLAGAASVEVSDPAQASAVDVEMKDAIRDADPKEASDAPKAEGEDQQTSNAAAPAKGATSGTGDTEARVKLEAAVKKEREITVDQDLVDAFRYFDKTGQCCFEPSCCPAKCMWTVSLLEYIMNDVLRLFHSFSKHAECC